MIGFAFFLSKDVKVERKIIGNKNKNFTFHFLRQKLCQFQKQTQSTQPLMREVVNGIKISLINGFVFLVNDHQRELPPQKNPISTCFAF